MRLETFLQGSSLQWLVKDLVPVNRKALVVARAGEGTAWALESLAMAVASGTPFLDHFPVLQRGPVLLVNRDSPRETLAERLAALRASSPGRACDLFVASQPAFALDRPSGAKALAKLMAPVRPVLLVLESLETLTSASFREDKSESVQRLFHGLEALQAVYRCAIVVGHQLRKRGQRAGLMAYLRGGSLTPARMDVGYAIQPLQESSGPPQFLLSRSPKGAMTASAFQVELAATGDKGRLVTASLRWTADVDPNLDAGLAERPPFWRGWLAAGLRRVHLRRW